MSGPGANLSCCKGKVTPCFTLNAWKKSCASKSDLMRTFKRSSMEPAPSTATLSKISRPRRTNFWGRTRPCAVRGKLKDSVGHLEGSLDDWKCAFYREKAKREEVTRELESLRRLNDEVEMLKQSLKEMTAEDEALKKSLRDLTVAGTPVAEMFEPTTSGEEPWPLVDRLRDMPDKILAFMHKMVRSIPQQVLSFVKSFYPTAKLELVGDGMAAECTKEKFEELMQQMAPVAERVAEWISLQ